MEKENVYKTEKVYFRFDDKRKEVYMKDLTDIYNETSGYNKKKRGYAKFKQIVIDLVNMKDMSSFYTYIRIANEKFNLSMHTYCAMD